MDLKTTTKCTFIAKLLIALSVFFIFPRIANSAMLFGVEYDWPLFYYSGYRTDLDAKMLYEKETFNFYYLRFDLKSESGNHSNTCKYALSECLYGGYFQVYHDGPAPKYEWESPPITSLIYYFPDNTEANPHTLSFLWAGWCCSVGVDISAADIVNYTYKGITSSSGGVQNVHYGLALPEPYAWILLLLGIVIMLTIKRYRRLEHINAKE